MQAKIQKQEEARALRQVGISVNEIATQLGVSKGSVSAWVRDVSITEVQKLALRTKSYNAGLRGFSKQTAHRNRRLEYQRVGAQLAEQLGDQPQFVGGCMLFWAEGSKDRNSAVLCNMDRYLMQHWWAFLQRYFGVRHDDVTLYIHCHTGNGNTAAAAEDYWLDALGLPRECLRKTTIIAKQGSVAKNRHPYGVCRLVVNSTELVQQLFGAVRQIAGISDPGWVD